MSVALESAEREKMKDDKMAMAIELAASRSDKELIRALHHRIILEEEKRLTSVETIKEVLGPCLPVSPIGVCYYLKLRVVKFFF